MAPDPDLRGLRPLIVAALLFVIVIGMKMAAYIVTILLVSLILTMLALPAMDRLRARGFPDILSVTVLTAAAAVFVLVLIGLTAVSFGVLARDIPLYQDSLDARVAEATGFLQAHGLDAPGGLAPPDLSALTGKVLSSIMSLGDLLLYIFFIAVTTFFMLLEAPHFIGRMKEIAGPASGRVSQMSRFMVDFIVVRTETNLVHGILFGGSLFVMGVHGALLWGILTFVLAFIPYIGLIIAAIPAIFFAWLQFGPWGAAAVVAIVCILNLVVENPVFSYFAARTFEIPALIVIVSVIFWGWLLGIAGMVFAVPITLLVLTALEYSEEFSWVNRLLGVDRMLRGEKKQEGGIAEP